MCFRMGMAGPVTVEEGCSSAVGECGIPAGEPMEEGTMKSSMFMCSAFMASSEMRACLSWDWLRSWAIPLGAVVGLEGEFLSSGDGFDDNLAACFVNTMLDMHLAR